MNMQSKNTPDYLYIDINIENDANNPVFEYKNASYRETRDADIIPQGKTDEYYMWVERFSIPTSVVPLFIYENNMYITVINNAGGVSQTLIQYDVNQTSNRNPPYDKAVYDYTLFLNSINIALNTALVASGSTAQGLFVFDSAIQLIRLVLSEVPLVGISWFPAVSNQSPPLPTTPAQGFQIVLSANLYSLLSTFSAKNLKAIDSTTYVKDNIDYSLILNNTVDPQANLIYPANQNPYLPNFNTASLVVAQQGASTFKWQTLLNIVLVSEYMPIIKEYIVSNTFNTNALIFPILQDYNVTGSEQSFNRSTYIYNASPHRYISLSNSSRFRDIDITLYFIIGDRLLPVILSPGDKVNVKLGLKRRFKYVKSFD